MWETAPSLWSDVSFKKEVIFYEFDFETSELELEVSNSNICKHTTSCDKGVFSLHYSRNFDDQLSSNFLRFVILCICWYTKWLWQLPLMSSVFKNNIRLSPVKIYWRLWVSTFGRFIMSVSSITCTLYTSQPRHGNVWIIHHEDLKLFTF